MPSHYWRIYFSSICDKLIGENAACGINQFCQFFRANFATQKASIDSTLAASNEEAAAEHAKKSPLRQNARALEKDITPVRLRFPKTVTIIEGDFARARAVRQG